MRRVVDGMNVIGTRPDGWWRDRPAALYAEIEARLNAVRSPFRTAERFGVEDIIDPRDTRPLLCDWAARAYEVLEHERGDGPKARGIRI